MICLFFFWQTPTRLEDIDELVKKEADLSDSQYETDGTSVMTYSYQVTFADPLK